MFGAGFKFREDLGSPVTITQRQTWQSIIDEIYVHTGVKLAQYEAVRRFAMGNSVNAPPELNTFPDWKPYQLKAVYDFLQPAPDIGFDTSKTHTGNDDWHPMDIEPVDLLMPNIVLDDLNPNVQIPYYMAEFFRDSRPYDGSIKLDNFAGYFLAENHAETVVTAYHLTLEKPTSDGIMQATLITEIIPKTKAHDPESSILDFEQSPDVVDHAKGWAFVTPQYDLVFLMKLVDPDEPTEQINLFMVTLAMDEGLVQGAPLNRFALLDNFGGEFPLPISVDGARNCLTASSYRKILKNTLIFKRFR